MSSYYRSRPKGQFWPDNYKPPTNVTSLGTPGTTKKPVVNNSSLSRGQGASASNSATQGRISQLQSNLHGQQQQARLNADLNNFRSNMANTNSQARPDFHSYVANTGSTNLAPIKRNTIGMAPAKGGGGVSLKQGSGGAGLVSALNKLGKASNLAGGLQQDPIGVVTHTPNAIRDSANNLSQGPSRVNTGAALLNTSTPINPNNPATKASRFLSTGAPSHIGNFAGFMSGGSPLIRSVDGILPGTPVGNWMDKTRAKMRQYMPHVANVADHIQASGDFANNPRGTPSSPADFNRGGGGHAAIESLSSGNRYADQDIRFRGVSKEAQTQATLYEKGKADIKNWATNAGTELMKQGYSKGQAQQMVNSHPGYRERLGRLRQMHGGLKQSGVIAQMESNRRDKLRRDTQRDLLLSASTGQAPEGTVARKIQDGLGAAETVAQYVPNARPLLRAGRMVTGLPAQIDKGRHFTSTSTGELVPRHTPLSHAGGFVTATGRELKRSAHELANPFDPLAKAARFAGTAVGGPGVGTVLATPAQLASNFTGIATNAVDRHIVNSPIVGLDNPDMPRGVLPIENPNKVKAHGKFRGVMDNVPLLGNAFSKGRRQRAVLGGQTGWGADKVTTQATAMNRNFENNPEALAFYNERMGRNSEGKKIFQPQTRRQILNQGDQDGVNDYREQAGFDRIFKADGSRVTERDIIQADFDRTDGSRNGGVPQFIPHGYVLENVGSTNKPVHLLKRNDMMYHAEGSPDYTGMNPFEAQRSHLSQFSGVMSPTSGNAKYSLAAMDHAKGAIDRGIVDGSKIVTNSKGVSYIPTGRRKPDGSPEMRAFQLTPAELKWMRLKQGRGSYKSQALANTPWDKEQVAANARFKERRAKQKAKTLGKVAPPSRGVPTRTRGVPTGVTVQPQGFRPVRDRVIPLGSLR